MKVLFRIKIKKSNEIFEKMPQKQLPLILEKKEVLKK